jgi:hypothetical protein
MAADAPKQKTQPERVDPATGKSDEPIEAGIPRREAIDQLLKRAAKSATNRLDRFR